MLHARSVFPACALVLGISLQCFSAPAIDYSKEAAVIENMQTRVSFSVEGTRDWRQVFSVRLQSEAAVRQFGVLAFSYSSLSEQVTVDYVRVKKPDGSLVETPATSVQDVGAGASGSAAPTYFDLRQKQIPVKALGVGDVLEYSVRTLQSKPEIPGQFWFTQPFINDAVVLSQTLEIEVPRDKYVQVTSPDVKAEVHDQPETRVYRWKYSHLEPTKPNEKKEADAKPPQVQITTFRNWEEVGTWWGTLANPESEPTPAIVAKARELTAGLSSNVEKEKAIYRYVATKFRYISVSLGVGRYRPHSADEVLGNQFGDCKDKHTLFVSLLRAAGIDAWPALIGAGIKFDKEVPSPAQFNHVITVIPQDGKYTWLDTTTEVAPFGLISASIRDESALVIPSGSPERKLPFLLQTPLDPPFESSEVVSVNGAWSSDGVLTARFAIDCTGDVAVDLRSGFRQLAPTQWQALAQQLSYAMNYSGEVSGVEVESLEDSDKPFHFSYDYKRKDYPGWKDSNITPPVAASRLRTWR